MRILIFFFLFLVGHNSTGQNRIPTLSQNAEISVITIGPGPELYDSFGHTAVRIRDVQIGLDRVFNYGLFDFDTPNFYTKFAQGKLLYRLDHSPFDDFLANYIAQKRSVTSQKLVQTLEEKQALFVFLFENAKEENSRYLYDFLYDNCATRPANAINSIYESDVFSNFKPEPQGLTHRQLIQKNVPWNTWGSFGMDIAIGSVTDRPVSNEAYLFLPEYFKNALITAKGTQGNLAEAAQIIFNPTTPNVYRGTWITSPLVVFMLLTALLAYFTYTDRKNKKGITLLDKTLLTATGVIGILIALLWFATEHAPTKWNYNLLWAFPFHLLAAFSIRKNGNKKWLFPYMKLAIILLVLLGFHWIVGVQAYPMILLPFLLAIAYRYVYILGELRKTINSQE
jgi:hypothetical protein